MVSRIHIDEDYMNSPEYKSQLEQDKADLMRLAKKFKDGKPLSEIESARLKQVLARFFSY